MTGRAVRLAGLLLAGVTGVAGLAGCGGGTAATGDNFVSGDGTITVVPPARRGEPVTLAGTSLEGRRLDLADHRGAVVVLNVWGSWCPPCRKEAPDLQAASQELAARGVVFLGLDTRDPDPAPALAFQRSFGVTYPSFADNGGRLLLSLRGAVSAKAIPTTLILDRQGRIAARISAATTRATLVDLVTDVLGGRTPGASSRGTPSATPSATASAVPSATASGGASPAASGSTGP